MPGITGITSLSSGFTPAFSAVRTLELYGPVFPGDASGDVYDLVAVNGAPPPVPQIVRILRDNKLGRAQRRLETVEALQRRILDDNRARHAAGGPPLQSLPTLRALPQFSFRGSMGDQPVVGYSADRLDTEGYLPLSRILGPGTEEEHRVRERYVAELTLEDRLFLAHELAEGLHALRRLSYVHGEISPRSLLVSVGACHVALADFGSGAVTDGTGDPSRTLDGVGEGEWMAPEIMDQFPAGGGGGPATVRVDLHTDDWALAVAIHHLLFLCGPFFALRHSGGVQIRDYASRFRWPAYDEAGPLFVPGLAASHAVYTGLLGSLPAAVLQRMTESLNAGALEPGRRASPRQWMQDLRGTREALEILLFQAEPEVVLEGRPVRLTWRVAGSRWAGIVPGPGDVAPAGSCEVLPAGSGSYTLAAEARGGQRIEETVSITVMPFPRLESVRVPAPSLSHTVILRNLRVPAPDIRLGAPVVRVEAPSIRLDPPSLHVAISLDLAVRFPEGRAIAVPAAVPLPPPSPLAPANGTGWARTDDVPRVIDVFNRLYDQLKTEISTQFGGTP